MVIHSFIMLYNTPAQDESRLYNLEQAAGGNGLDVNPNKIEFLCFEQEVAISTYVENLWN